MSHPTLFTILMPMLFVVGERSFEIDVRQIIGCNVFVHIRWFKRFCSSCPIIEKICLVEPWAKFYVV